MKAIVEVINQDFSVLCRYSTSFPGFSHTRPLEREREGTSRWEAWERGWSKLWSENRKLSHSEEGDFGTDPARRPRSGRHVEPSQLDLLTKRKVCLNMLPSSGKKKNTFAFRSKVSIVLTATRIKLLPPKVISLNADYPAR